MMHRPTASMSCGHVSSSTSPSLQGPAGLVQPHLHTRRATVAHPGCAIAAAAAPAALYRPACSARATRCVAAAISVHEPQPTVSRRAQDYAASPTDDGVLRLPPRTELEPSMITHVFGYGRDLLERYYVGKVIGAGSFGVVRECIDIVSGERRAIKTVSKTPKRGAPTPRYLLKLRNEVEIMKQLGFSLDAVNLRDVFEDADSIHLIMELCEGGALLERIESNSYSEVYIAGVVRCILRFISQCHAKGIIYRDVKPDNFLFLTKEEDSHLRATDMGLSIRHWPDQEKLTARSGTPAYMAPELVLQAYDSKSDVWSVGMLTYQLLTGRFPFWEDVRSATLTQVWKAILTKEINWEAEEVVALSPPAIDFLRSLLVRTPEDRPTAEAALQHGWLQEEGQGPAGNTPMQGSVVQRLQRFSTYGRLKQLVLKMIVIQIQDDERNGTMPSDEVGAMMGLQSASQELFEQLDADSSGSISVEELASGLKEQGYQLAESEVDVLVRGIDLDRDRNIESAEFLSTMVDWSVVQSQQDWQMHLDRVFSQMDLDGDGCIDLDELVSLLRGCVHGDEECSVEENELEQLATAKQMLREADINGDGHIDKEEFYELLHVSHAPDSLFFYDDRLEATGTASTRQKRPPAA